MLGDIHTLPLLKMDPDGHYKEPTYTKITIKAPQGKLGIRLIDQIVGHDCRWRITSVNDDSPLIGKIRPGDFLVTIDNIDVSRMNAKMFESTFQKRRAMARMEFLRAAVLPPVVSNSSSGGRRIESINNRNRVMATPVEVVQSNDSSNTPMAAATIATRRQQQSDQHTIAAATHVTNRTFGQYQPDLESSTVAESTTVAPQSVVSTWTCSKCTFINDEGSDETDKCIMCQGLRDSPSILDDPTTANVSETVYSNFASSSSVSSEVSKRKDPPEERLSSAHTDCAHDSSDSTDAAIKWTRGSSATSGGDSNETGDISSNPSGSYSSDRLSSLRRFTTDSDTSLRFSTLMHDLEEEKANNEGGNDRAHSSMSMHDFEEGKKNGGGGGYRASAQGSMSHLGNMSFAAWEADRKHWTCEVCTFKNEPRFLMCGGCGMAEGCTAIEDELIAKGLERMPLSKAQDFLVSLYDYCIYMIFHRQNAYHIFLQMFVLHQR